MKRLTLLAASGLTCLTPSSWAGEEAGTKGIAGDWEGTLTVTPQVRLRITLKVAEAKDGKLSGSWGSPVEGLEGVPRGSIALDRRESKAGVGDRTTAKTSIYTIDLPTCGPLQSGRGAELGIMAWNREDARRPSVA